MAISACNHRLTETLDSRIIFEKGNTNHEIQIFSGCTIAGEDQFVIYYASPIPGNSQKGFKNSMRRMPDIDVQKPNRNLRICLKI